MLEAQREVEAMLTDRRSFEEIEERIESLGLPEAQRAALWLLAWAEQDARTRRRVASEALAHVADRAAASSVTRHRPEAANRDATLHAARDIRAAVRSRRAAASQALDAYDSARGDRLAKAIAFLRAIKESDQAYADAKRALHVEKTRWLPR